MNKDFINISGFNQGYELARVDNELALSTISEIDENSTERLQFFKEGVLEFEKEKLYERLKSNDRNMENEKELDK